MAIYNLKIYVPKPGTWSERSIAAGSGIVGRPVRDLIRIDYEGGIYGANFSYEEKLFHAAGRHLYNEGEGYPTVARSHTPPADLIEVGDYIVDTSTWRVEMVITDQATLDRWKNNGKTESS
jgi:hypothetical protein